MTSNLKIILNRLLEENLHPPTILQINTPLRDDWVIVDNKLSLNSDQDLDSQDPRWCELFREVVIKTFYLILFYFILFFNIAYV